MREELTEVFDGSMKGRTMHVVPFSMGPSAATSAQLGVEITDSPYVVLSMGIMTRMGEQVYRLIEAGEPWVRTIHSLGYPLVDGVGHRRDGRRLALQRHQYIVSSPTRARSGRTARATAAALLAKKAFALRIASVMARDEGWLAEHMLLIKITSPEAKAYHVAAAFPSACGKTNLAMLRPRSPAGRSRPSATTSPGCVPARTAASTRSTPRPGSSASRRHGRSTNPTAVQTLWGNTIFTNVAPPRRRRLVGGPHRHAARRAHRLGGQPGRRPPAGPPRTRTRASRVAAAQCPQISDDWDAHDGVPIDAILFGGRRATLVPLVAEARSWKHGVFMGATISSEQTAAAEGTVGELRRDPFAMLPFCGCNMADYWGTG